MSPPKLPFEKLEVTAYSFLVEVRTNLRFLQDAIEGMESLTHRYGRLYPVLEKIHADEEHLLNLDRTLCVLFPNLNSDVAHYFEASDKPPKGKQSAKVKLAHKDYPKCKHCGVKTRPDNVKAHEQKCQSNPANKPGASKCRCDFCGKPCKNGTGKFSHERACADNPDRNPVRFKKKAAKKAAKKATKKKKGTNARTRLATKKPDTAKYLCNSCGKVQKMSYVGERKDCPKCGARKVMDAVEKYDDKGDSITLTDEENARI